MPSDANEMGKPPVISWNGFLMCGSDIEEKVLTKRSAAIRPGHCASLIYTSGTTGNPKAVMMTHDNLIFDCLAVWEQLYAAVRDTVPDNLRSVSYLPLSHVAAQMLDVVGTP